MIELGTRRLLGVVAMGTVCAIVGLSCRAGALGEGSETRATMGRIFESIRVLLPLSVREGAFAAPENQATIRQALGQLSLSASAVASHAGSRDEGFGFLGRSLSTDVAEALRQFEHGRPDSAAFRVGQVTEYCVACHARFPSSDSLRAESFIEKSQLAALPTEERAKLQIATRQFDAALASFETLFEARAVHPAEMLGPLTDYLTISIRVKHDLERPVPVLQKLAKRSDVRRYILFDIDRWIASLREFAASPPPAATLESARELIAGARTLITFPADRQALIHYIVASEVLYRFLESKPAPGPDVGEAYYLLGLMESRIGRDYGASQIGFLLETGIRTAPREPFAEVAFALLEEETLLDYGALTYAQLPDDVATHLNALQALIDPPAASAP